MNREGKSCLLYSRVSTEIQVDGYSLDAQKNGLKRFAEREEMTVVDIYEDAGKSGKSIEGGDRHLKNYCQMWKTDWMSIMSLYTNFLDLDGMPLTY